MFYHPLGSKILWFYRETAYEAVRFAEREKGAPVNVPEVIRAYRKVTSKPLVSPHFVSVALLDCYWNDELLADRELNYISLNPKNQHTDDNPTGFDIFSDRINRFFPGYVLDQ